MSDSDLRSLICYESDAVLVVNKPPGMPVQAKSGRDLVSLMGEQDHQVHLINRVDQPASGAIIFARNPRYAADLSEQMQSKRIIKIYWAIVGREPENKEGILTHYLMKLRTSNKSKAVMAGTQAARRASLTYRWMGRSERYHLLQVQLETGRHHQIRTQLAAVGLPIKGDVKYGFRRKNPDRSIHLHARSVVFIDPSTGELVSITAKPPQEKLWNYFEELMKVSGNQPKGSHSR